ncbi:hypothetical protein THAOC_19054 [Thalassiosira oceanica]|uniref:Helicase-associated domain-containing protein n=1 Tax=Thalassiosira oceanica TaxID=159749 RepID=K0SHS8_THAOC|nr:hypothetical protein THAOC_19054 [Thalassiosira oceanica]|eukprot:EJK60566.1 hypothetical protein THAOC_19054 [Thalassiosira oceanica]
MKRHQLLLPAGLLIAASERCGALISLSPHAREGCHSRLRPDDDRRTLESRGSCRIGDFGCKLHSSSAHLDEPPRIRPNETWSHGSRDTFAQRLRELEEYKREHGHCSVPRRYRENPSLANWVNKQRQNYRKRMKEGKSPLTERVPNATAQFQQRKRHIEDLERLGFLWNASQSIRQPMKSSQSDKAWKAMYLKLVEFETNEGHCNVPSTTSLGRWVVRQRHLYRRETLGQPKSSLTDERIELLNRLSFPWATRSEQLWQQRVDDLKQFQRENNHCMVPKEYTPNPSLATWVSTQRKNYNRRKNGLSSSLTPERIKELDEIGFVWRYWDHKFIIDNANNSK